MKLLLSTGILILFFLTEGFTQKKERIVQELSLYKQDFERLSKEREQLQQANLILRDSLKHLTDRPSLQELWLQQYYQKLHHLEKDMQIMASQYNTGLQVFQSAGCVHIAFKEVAWSEDHILNERIQDILAQIGKILDHYPNIRVTVEGVMTSENGHLVSVGTHEIIRYFIKNQLIDPLKIAPITNMGNIDTPKHPLVISIGLHGFTPEKSEAQQMLAEN